MALTLLIDYCAIGALVIAVHSGVTPPALMVGYSVTALAALTMVLLLLFVMAPGRLVCKNCEDRRYVSALFWAALFAAVVLGLAWCVGSWLLCEGDSIGIVVRAWRAECV